MMVATVTMIAPQAFWVHSISRIQRASRLLAVVEGIVAEVQEPRPKLEVVGATKVVVAAHRPLRKSPRRLRKADTAWTRTLLTVPILYPTPPLRFTCLVAITSCLRSLLYSC